MHKGYETCKIAENVAEIVFSFQKLRAGHVSRTYPPNYIVI